MTRMPTWKPLVACGASVVIVVIAFAFGGGIFRPAGFTAADNAVYVESRDEAVDAVRALVRDAIIKAEIPQIDAGTIDPSIQHPYVRNGSEYAFRTAKTRDSLHRQRANEASQAIDRGLRRIIDNPLSYRVTGLVSVNTGSAGMFPDRVDVERIIDDDEFVGRTLLYVEDKGQPLRYDVHMIGCPTESLNDGHQTSLLGIFFNEGKGEYLADDGTMRKCVILRRIQTDLIEPMVLQDIHEAVANERSRNGLVH